MKKLLSIALIAILLLNAVGYYGVFLRMYYKNDVAMTESFDSDQYDESEAITIKVPVSLPYVPDQSEFVRVNGKFEHQGNLYRLIKQRYEKDTLTIICMQDVQHEKIDNELADYVKTLTDKASDAQSTSKVNVNFLKDYLPTTFSIRPLCSGWASNVILNTDDGTLIPSFSASIIHPPERA